MAKRYDSEVDERVGEVVDKMRSWRPKRPILMIISVIALILLFWGMNNFFIRVPADKMTVVQMPYTGDLKWCIEPGWYLQWWGTPTTYRISWQFWHSYHPAQGGKEDESIGCMFNDGGKGRISGSVRVDMPKTEALLTGLHRRYGSQAAIEHDLIRPVFEKAVYMSGPLMSSRESYAEKKSLLITYIEDQAYKGVYQTTIRAGRVKDLISGVEKTAEVVEIVRDPKTNLPLRQEQSPLEEFGLRCYGYNINRVVYDDLVEAQIAQQQKSIQDVQTAIVQAKQAEQRTLTTIEEGKASAAKSKWEQETIKAKEVTAAEQRKAVAALDRDAAEFYKQKLILEGEGESGKRRMVMEADGALEIKGGIYERVMGRIAQEFGKQKWVPEVMLGGGTNVSGGDQIASLMNLFSLQALNSLGLDLTIPKVQTTKPAVSK